MGWAIRRQKAIAMRRRLMSFVGLNIMRWSPAHSYIVQGALNANKRKEMDTH